MAAQRRTGGSGGYNAQGAGRHYTTTYIDGNVVRHIQTAPKRGQQRETGQKLSNETRRNRERALNINMPYVIFLAAASAAAIFLCVQYLQLQAAGTTYRNTIASLESSLSMDRQANDTAYEEAISSVSMEQIKEIAVKELGMVYAGEGQIITYNNQDGDYIRQYGEIPDTSAKNSMR